MTESRDILQRPKGDGWLVLADRVPSFEGEFSSLANSLLTHANLAYPPLCILAGNVGDAVLPKFLADLEMLLDVESTVVGLNEVEDWDSLNPGILILTGGTPEDWVTAIGETHIGILILQALSEGLLLFAVDSAATSLGSWVISEIDDTQHPGLNWLVGALVLTWTDAPADHEPVRSLLSGHEPLYAMGLSGGRMIALGPSGEVELWGAGAPTIVLGSGWQK